MVATANNNIAQKPSLLILILMSAIGPFGDTEYTPALPMIAQELHTTYATVELTMTSYLLGYAISQLFYGPLSDRFGRRPIMMIGTLFFILGSLICIFSHSIEILIAGRFVQALGACAGNVLSPAIVRDSFTEKERPKTYAKIMMAYALGPVLGPIVGSVLISYFSWHSNFILLLILGILLLFCVQAMLIETKLDRNLDAMRFKHFFNNYASLFRDPYYLSYILLLGTTFGVVYSCLVESPALIEYVREHSTFAANLSVPEIFTIITLCVGGGYISGSAIAKTNSLTYTPNQIITSGLCVMLVANLALLYFAHSNIVNMTTMLTPIAIIFIGIGMIAPMAMSSAMLPFSDISGSAAAMMGFGQMSIASGSTVIISLVHSKSATPMPDTFSILIIAGILIHIGTIVSRPNKERYHR